MHHKRVVQEKNRLITDIKRLKARGRRGRGRQSRDDASPATRRDTRGPSPVPAPPPPPVQAHYSKYEPTILELKRKYEAAMKEKMLAGLERDKMAAKARRGGGEGWGRGQRGLAAARQDPAPPRALLLAAAHLQRAPPMNAPGRRTSWRSSCASSGPTLRRACPRAGAAA
jgi:hypothetical protein